MKIIRTYLTFLSASAIYVVRNISIRHYLRSAFNYRDTGLLGAAIGYGFTLSFAISFVLMSQIVKHEGAIISALYTYGLSQLFFGILRSPQVLNTVKRSVLNWRLFILINALTLANTILVYLVLIHVSAFTYVLVFFGTTPASSYLISRYVLGNHSNRAERFELWVGIIALSAGIFREFTTTQPSQTADAIPMIGLLLTIIASLAGAAYLHTSKRFQTITDLSSSDIVFARFAMTVIVCTGWLLATDQTVFIEFDSLLIYTSIALLGSVIPLFFLQKSTEKNGAAATASYMPFIPLLCGVVSYLLFPNGFSVLDALFAMIVFIAMIVSNVNKQKESLATR